MNLSRQRMIRALFTDYIRMYASRDDRLTGRFSDNFSGYTGGGDFIVGDKGEWIAITQHDFSQVPGRIRIQMLNLLLRDLSNDVVVATGLFHIHLPIPERVLSREAVRLTLVFRLEEDGWKIAHSGISVPYHLVQPGEVYPIKSLYDRNQQLESLLKEQTRALEDATRQLDDVHQISRRVRQYLEPRLANNPDINIAANALNYSRRSLTRRLKEEGTSFLQIKDRLRRKVASELLIKDQFPVEAIATQIGISNLTTFHRSFKKWTGTTPRAYRRLVA